MTQKSLAKEALPLAGQEALRALGRNISLARKRRRLSLETLAGTMMVTRKTLMRLEAGDPSVGLAVLVSALHALDMVDDLKKVAAPETDAIGLFNEKLKLPTRVRKKKEPGPNLEF